MLSTDPIISIDCARKYLTSPSDSTLSAFPTAPHNASCKTLELLTASAGRLANVTLTVDTTSALPEGKGVGENVGSRVGTTEGDSEVGYAVGRALGETEGFTLGSTVGRALGAGLGDMDVVDTAARYTRLKSTGPA